LIAVEAQPNKSVLEKLSFTSTHTIITYLLNKYFCSTVLDKIPEVLPMRPAGKLPMQKMAVYHQFSISRIP